MKKLIIFDLDGTLLNTIADLAQSTNHALQALGYPTHPESVPTSFRSRYYSHSQNVPFRH